MVLERVEHYEKITKATHLPNAPSKRSRTNILPHFAKPLAALKIIPVPALEECWTCTNEGRNHKKTTMYIKSTALMAEIRQGVLWKCPQCGHTKWEKFKSIEEAVYFWNYANKKGWVLINDKMYTHRHGRKY